MSNTQEFSGKNVDVAVQNACSALNIPKSELDYEVVFAGKSGVFGIVGRKDARIRVTLPGAEEETGDELEGIRSIVDEAFGEETRVNVEEEEDTHDWRAQEKKYAKAKSSRVEAQQPEEDEEEEEIIPVTQASIDLGIEALQKMADLITDGSRVEAEANGDRLTLRIEGGNTGILIGRKGQTLDAMQFLTDKIINRQSEARVRVKVDIEGYMETRKENLRQLAFKMAEKAKKTGRPATINQMSAQDRRIVHLALKDDSRVRTQSMGDG
ncbi:MAG: Jag N-terminal domain-containing protein, partial [Desulfobacterales bacterium]|nr:Jag N-terminal domain-containing protein [Desulfobacterales bacterium]